MGIALRNPFSSGGSDDEKRAGSPAEVNEAITSGETEPITDAPQDDLHRGMKPRQLNMMAIAGAIGTGLIIGSGTALRNGGPGSLLIAYIMMGYVVYVVMVALGEMATMFPHKKSFSGYAARFVDPAMGFATGWNYFLKYVVVLPNNLTATGLLLQYWRPDINVSVWVTVFGVAIIALNLIHVSFFGEAEFWMSLIKALVIIMLIFMCFILALGGGPNKFRSGFYYWQNPGAFAEYKSTGDTGRFLGVWASLVQATFAYLGTELVGVAFGETPNPRKNVPRAVRQTLMRIIFFYIGGVITLGMAVPYNHPLLIDALAQKVISGRQSPFTVAAGISGVTGLADAVNALLLVFTVSAANSDIYLAARSVWALSKDGLAPEWLGRTNKRGVPVQAVILSSVFIALGYMNATTDAAKVFGYFVSLVTVFGALNWVSVLISYICMMRGLKAQGIPRSAMPYTNPLLPWGAYIALPFTCLIILFNGWTAFIPWQVDRFITSYIGVPIFIINVVWFKIWRKTKKVKPEEMDLVSDRRE